MWTTVIASLFLAVQLLLGVSSARAQAQEPGPETSVYTVINSDGSSEGVATLINSRKGVFLTASHVVANASAMLIKRGDMKLKFKVLLRGNNIARTIEDWALLQADEDDWKTEKLRTPLKILYDPPVSADLSSAFFLSAPSKTSNFVANQWTPDQSSVAPCSADSVILAQTVRYDKGFSGAAVYVQSPKKGIIAITSRFETAGDPQDSEIIQLFAKVSKQIEDERSDASPISASVLRDIIKDKIFIKIVPIKCIIDQIISADISRAKLFATEESPEMDDVEDTITRFMPETLPEESREAKLIEITNTLGSIDLSIVGVMQVLDRYVATFKDSKLPMDFIKLQLFASIRQSSQKIYAYNLPAAYIRATTTETVVLSPNLQSAPPTDQLGLDTGSLLKSFAQKNAEWAYVPGVKRIQFDTSALPKSGLNAAENMMVGNKISEMLRNSELVKKMSPETKSLFENSAVLYLANGLNDAPLFEQSSNVIVANTDTLRSMSNLGKVLQGAESSFQAKTSPSVSIGGRLAELGGANSLKNMSIGSYRLDPTMGGWTNGRPPLTSPLRDFQMRAVIPADPSLGKF